jgi:hypothetical protein
MGLERGGSDGFRVAGHLTPTERRVDHDLLLDEKGDELSGAGGVEDGCSEGFFAAVGEHGSRDELEVVDHVHAVGYALEGIDRVGDVAGDGEAAAVGFGADGAEDVGLELGVDLDLVEVGVGIGVDGVDGLGDGVGIDGTKGQRAAGVDEASEEHARAEVVFGIDGVADVDKEVELAAAVAGGGDSCGEQRGTELDPGIM